MNMTLGSVLTLFGILSFIIIMKVLICSCVLRRWQGSRNEDTRPILEEAAERLQEIHQQRIRSRQAREQPPTFDDALRNSRPVSYIDVEEPPPTYDDYLNANLKNSCMESSYSVHPADVIIPLESNFNSNGFQGESSA